MYFGHATEHFAHVVQLEGMQAGNYNDFQLTYVQMGSDMIQDTQVKTGGSDASTPMGTGLAINVITKSGGNTFRGHRRLRIPAAQLERQQHPPQDRVQPLGHAARHALHVPQPGMHVQPAARRCRPTSVSSTARSAGPIMKDRVWFFTSFRKSAVETQISRNSKNVNDIKSYYPDAELFPQQIKGYQPYVKVTSRVGTAHELSGFFQRDRTHGQSNWQYYFDPINVYSNGGNVYSAKLTSTWGDRLTTTFSAGYNNKSGNDNDTYEAFGFDAQGPNIDIYDGTRISSGFITGNSLILEGGNNADSHLRARVAVSDSRRHDVLQGRLDRLPRVRQPGSSSNRRTSTTSGTEYTNDGFFREYQTVVDVNDPSKGTRPYRRDYANPDQPADAPGARQQLRVLPAGQLEAERTPDGESRDAVRLRQAR